MFFALRIMFCLSILLTTSNSYAFEERYSKDDKFEKIYLEPEQIIVGKEGLFININDVIFQVPKLQSDNAGVYIGTNYLALSKYENVLGDMLSFALSVEDVLTAYAHINVDVKNN